jgi:hypothetical protein
LFDIDANTISIYIDEINMHHKIRLRDDSRIDATMFFNDEMMFVGHVKKLTNNTETTADDNNKSNTKQDGDTSQQSQEKTVVEKKVNKKNNSNKKPIESVKDFKN